VPAIGLMKTHRSCTTNWHLEEQLRRRRLESKSQLPLSQDSHLQEETYA
jgi:hypothetical protein